MAVPTPAIPTFTDGTVLSASLLNALGANISNLFAYNQGGFHTQRPCVIAKQTTSQSIPAGGLDTLVSFNAAPVNTDNMWDASNANQLQINTPGIYWLFSQLRWPLLNGSIGNISGTVGDIIKGASSSILVNGTSTATNSVATQCAPYLNFGNGTATQCGALVNLAAGSAVYLNAWQNSISARSLSTDYGGSYLGAIFLTPSA